MLRATIMGVESYHQYVHTGGLNFAISSYMPQEMAFYATDPTHSLAIQIVAC